MVCLVVRVRVFTLPFGCKPLWAQVYWLERCGHGLTSRPLEASGSGFLDDLLSLIGCPSGSGGFLLPGTLRLWYCSSNFCKKKPTWGIAGLLVVLLL